MHTPRILLVEDESVVALDLQSRLHALGYDTCGAADSGEDALTRVEASQPDLVLMDIRLKGAMDGIGAAEEIRRRWRLPVIYLTAYSEDSTLQRAKLTEPFGYIIKPFDDRDLRSTIEMALYKHASEQRLRESERRYSTTLRSIGDGVIATDHDGCVTFLNPVAEALTGWPEPDARGRRLAEVFRTVNETTRQPVEDPVARVLRENRVVGLANHTLLVNRDGRDIPIEDSAAPIHDDAGAITGTVLVFQDVTARREKDAERERLQAQLAQAQKMESVGRLAGGVAHDFNNMLQAILGNVALAQQDVPPDSPVRESLDEIRKSAERSADLTRQLLAFARKQTIAPVVLNLNDTVASLARMLRRLIGEEIQLAWSLGAELWLVRLDPSQVDQALVNLSVNARDAMVGAGRVTIETANVVLDPASVADHPECAPGEYVMLAVGDTGAGMDAETLSHLFEPFFTTKPVGKGTGLGLATVFGIVKQNGGLVRVESAPGQGTSVRLYFPRVAGTVVEAAAPPVQPKRGTETILLVEDEEQVLLLGRRILAQQGYAVLVAATPDEALVVAAGHGGRIHLLVTDVVMPGMNGRILRDRLRVTHPDLKCLFMSGYPADAIAHHGVLEAGVLFLQKPFSIDALAQMVRTALD